MEAVGDGDPHLGENHATVDGHHAFVAGQDRVHPGSDGPMVGLVTRCVLP